MLEEHIDPETYQEAMDSENSDKWYVVIKEEVDFLMENKT